MFIFVGFLSVSAAEGKTQKFCSYEISQDAKVRSLHCYSSFCFVLLFCQIRSSLLFHFLSLKMVFFKKKKFPQLRNFATSSSFITQFCFNHNFFIRTPFWVILVPLERLESVESKYSHKNTFEIIMKL